MGKTIEKRKCWKDLTKKEREHMQESGCNTLWKFKETVANQEKMRAQNPRVEPCWECKFIAKKLGLI